MGPNQELFLPIVGTALTTCSKNHRAKLQSGLSVTVSGISVRS